MTNLPRIPAAPANSGWQSDAACRGLGDDLFFAPGNERGQTRRRRENRAKAICAKCSVVGPCLAWALAAEEAYGVWGGRTEAERLRLGAPSRSGSGPTTRALPD